MRRAVAVLVVVACLTGVASARAWAQTPSAPQAAIDRVAGQVVTSVHFDVEGRRSDAQDLHDLVEVPVGQPLDLAQLRSSVVQLFSADRFEDVSVRAVPEAAGVSLIFQLVPKHVIDRVEFRGDTGMDRADLETSLRRQFGGTPRNSQVDAAARWIERLLNDEGYRRASVKGTTEVSHAPERATLVLSIAAGPRAVVRSAAVDGASPLSKDHVLGVANVRLGEPYKPKVIDAGLDKIVEELREDGHYTASASHARDVVSDDGRSVDVAITVDAGGVVTLKFTGDPPVGRLDTLVPIRREGSADDDLLEDSVRRVENALKHEGYWNATASYTRTPSGANEVITIDVHRGPRYKFGRFDIRGNTAMAETAIVEMFGLTPDQWFDESLVARGVAALRDAYLLRGYAAVQVKTSAAAVPGATAAEPRVVETITIDEGPMTRVTDVRVTGASVLAVTAIKAAMQLAAGKPYVAALVPADRDAVKDRYDIAGYASAVVDVRAQLSDSKTGAVILVDIASEGRQTVLDRVIITGNRRVAEQTIRDAIQLRTGQPLGLNERLELQQRLASMGLFRRVSVTEAPHPAGEAGTDLIITVEESPTTTLAYGGGLEAGFRSRTTTTGQEDRFEVAPRASVELSRSNLWGKNRTASLTAGVSLRPIDDTGNPERDGKCCGFSEYRVVTSLREPQLFGTRADGLLSLTAEQAIRNSFNFSRRDGSAQILRRLNSVTSFIGAYSIQRVVLSNVAIQPSDQLLVDRLFPQIRLSIFSGSLSRDTRNDPLSPTGGYLTAVDGNVATRALGSQVGFAKVFLQGFTYKQVGPSKRVVFAGGARLGLVRGFVRTIDGQRVEDVPASQRFFSGGSTTVRGFEIDRLGTPDLLDSQGLSNGGNGLVVFNAELRTSITRSIGTAVFFDTGQVFRRVSAIDLTQLRASLGAGVRYRSPLGPMRFDFGWKLGDLWPTDGRRWVFHFSIGEAF